MMLGLVVLMALLLRLARGGSLRDLAELRLRGESLFAVALLAVITLPAGATLLHPSHSLVIPAWILVMGLLLALCLINIRSSSGFRTLALGVALNMIVIAANGRMPVSSVAATAVAGSQGHAAVLTGDYFHFALNSVTRLTILSDIIPAPGSQGLRAVLSIGDVLMYAGVLSVLVAFSPLQRERLTESE